MQKNSLARLSRPTPWEVTEGGVRSDSAGKDQVAIFIRFIGIMGALNFEKIGAFVYGVHRLDGALSALTQWLSGGVRDTEVDSPDEKFAKRLAAATSFFSAQHEQDELRKEYVLVLRTFNELENECAAFLSSDQSAALDNYLIKTRWTHSALADVIEKIGYPGIPPSFLRTHGSRG